MPREQTGTSSQQLTGTSRKRVLHCLQSPRSSADEGMRVERASWAPDGASHVLAGMQCCFKRMGTDKSRAHHAFVSHPYKQGELDTNSGSAGDASLSAAAENGQMATVTLLDRNSPSGRGPAGGQLPCKRASPPSSLQAGPQLLGNLSTALKVHN